VSLRPDVIVTTGTPATLAVKHATSTIPIVQTVGAADLVREGVVVSLARPGGNLTGLTENAPELTAKRLALLKEVVPGLARVALLGQAGSPNTALQMAEIRAAAQALEVELQILEARSPGDLEGLVEAAGRERADGLMMLTDPITVAHREQIAELARKSRLPSMFDRREFAVGARASGGAAVGATTEAASRPRVCLRWAGRGARPMACLLLRALPGATRYYDQRAVHMGGEKRPRSASGIQRTRWGSGWCVKREGWNGGMVRLRRCRAGPGPCSAGPNGLGGGSRGSGPASPETAGPAHFAWHLGREYS
jgi:hypothetical protein